MPSAGLSKFSYITQSLITINSLSLAIISQQIKAPRTIDGYQCESLENILAFKKKANRPKDQQDIKNIETYLNNSKKKTNPVIFGASHKGYEIAQNKFGKNYQVYKIDPDNLAEAKKSHRDLIASQTPIMVFGPVGSNTIPIDTEVYITESRWLNPKTPNSLVAKLAKPLLAGAPSLGVPCYTSEKFVTKTTIKDPIVFDKVLAYLLQDGFSITSSWRIVSDNLSKTQFEQFKKRPI